MAVKLTRRTWALSLSILSIFVVSAVHEELFVGGGDSGPVAGILINEPVNMSVSNVTTVNFGFYPVVGNGTFVNCSLWTNETGTMQLEEWNQSAIVNGSVNTIEHTLVFP